MKIKLNKTKNKFKFHKKLKQLNDSEDFLSPTYSFRNKTKPPLFK